MAEKLRASIMFRHQMLHHIIIMSVIGLVFAHGLDLQVRPRVFRAEDNGITISCFFPDQQLLHLPEHAASVSQLGLVKASVVDGFQTEEGTTVSSMTLDNAQPSIFQDNATATGFLGRMSESFLNVTWHTVSTDKYGKYWCESMIIGNGFDRSIKREIRPVSDDAIYFLQLLDQYARERSTQLKEDVLNNINGSFSNILSEFRLKFEDLVSRAENMSQTNQKVWKVIKEDLDEKEDEKKIIGHNLWPEGNFTLMMTDSGCPKDPEGWNKGFHKLKTSPLDPFYPLNGAKHLPVPRIRDSILYQQYCTMYPSPERQKAWPAGTYCIHTIHSGCPDSIFKKIVLNIDHLDGDTVISSYGPVPIISKRYISQVTFCCRHDGSPLTPIVLPASTPFFLHRYRGVCQEVTGMEVAQDSYMIGTFNDDGGDKWVIDDDASNRPDVSTGPIRETLCYYSPKNIIHPKK